MKELRPAADGVTRSGIYSDLTFRRQVQSLIKTYYRVTGKIESTVLRAIQ